MYFANPAFLWALSAAVIPIIVHLFNFRRHKTVYFSNVDMIRELQVESRRQRNVKQLAVLACRILVVVFLVLAFARPTLNEGGMPLKRGDAAVSVYVDNSFSLANTNDGVPLLEMAKQRAREIVSEYGQSDCFQLVTNDVMGYEYRKLTKDEMMLYIDEIDLSPVSADVSGVAKKQHDFLNASGCSNLYAYQVSDFQKTATTVSDYPSDSNIATVLVPLSAKAENNVFIDSLAFHAPAFFAGNVVNVDVYVRNNGDVPIENLPLKLIVNNRQRAIASVDVAVGGQTVQSMSFAIGEETRFDGYVELVDYPIVFDDRFFFSINVNETLSVLCVNDGAENSSLRRLFGADSTVRYTVTSVQNMGHLKLDEYNLVVLDELYAVTTGIASDVRTYVEEGGNLTVVLADNLDVDSYNAFLLSLKAPTLSVFERQTRKMTQINHNNELYATVFNGEPEDMEMPTLQGCYRLDVGSRAVYTPIVYYDRGVSFVGVTPFGMGNMYMVAAPLREEYTDFVNQPMFVPTLYNMALQGAHSDKPYYVFGDVENVVLRCINQDSVKSSIIKGTEGGFESAAEMSRLGNKCVLKIPRQMVEAGNYTVGNISISFNYNRKESVLEFYGKKDLEQQVAEIGHVNVKVIGNGDNAIGAQVRQLHEGVPLWRLFVVISLIFVLAEIILLRIK